jgi:acetate kinase
MKILVLNAGSSSQKSCLYEFSAEALPAPSQPLWEAEIEWSHHQVLAELKVATAQGASLEETLQSESQSEATGHMLRTLWSGPTKIITQPEATHALNSLLTCSYIACDLTLVQCWLAWAGRTHWRLREE